MGVLGSGYWVLGWVLMGTDAWALKRVSEKATCRIAHPSPHDTVSGAVWDGDTSTMPLRSGDQQQKHCIC
jgi:hypothetical protein